MQDLPCTIIGLDCVAVSSCAADDAFKLKIDELATIGSTYRPFENTVQSDECGAGSDNFLDTVCYGMSFD